ncbi:MAG: pilus assembly protein [Gemmataceae bacterium]|nr:pilus assembly protein [Gemmataceae bacterium]
MRLQPVRRPRRGATVVESAVVLVVFLFFLFALFEYCRFLMILHTANNAARDAARYAVVNRDKPATFNTADYTDGGGRVYPSVVNYAKDRMGPTKNQLDGFAVSVYPCDPAGLAESPPVVRYKPKTADDLPDPVDPSKPVWNSAPFPNRIAVTITGTYRPAVPTGVKLSWLDLRIFPDSVPINITAVMGSEG